ncbi:hypothetical protein HN011_008604 [Eciton burchellii]|nr:hypothetical protein HN011_008604 [Eciton burchellii]
MTICIENYLSLNKILLLTVGLWLYHRTKLVEFHLFFFTAFLTSFIIVQFTVFLTAECTSDIVIKILSYISLSSLCLIYYTSFYINSDTMKYILDNFQDICNELKDEDEIAIMKEYLNVSKRFTHIVSLYAIGSLLFFIFLPIFPQVLGIFTFINVSITENLMVQVMREYFIDQEKYSYFILLHLDAAICIVVISLTAIGSLFVNCCIYICGIFRIASYRVEQAMVIPFQSIKLSNEFRIQERLIHAIDIHRKGIELCSVFISSFEKLFCFMISTVIICLSLNLYELFQAVKFKSTLSELFMQCTCVNTLLVFILIANCIGQEITNHYNHMFISAYNLQWYETPVFIQKIILFLLQKGTKNFRIVFGGLIVVSMESAAMLLSTSISYFTVLYSAQQTS